MYIENLKKFRENEKLTQGNVADILKIRQQQYSLYETGKRDLPTENLIKLAKLYNTTTDELLGIK